jgi:hypothetical protein
MCCISAEELIPKLGLLEGIYDTIAIVDHTAVRTAFNSGKVKGVLGEIVSLHGDEATLANKETVKVRRCMPVTWPN